MPDALSEVLQSIRLSGAVFFVVDCHPPFAAEAPRAAEIAARVMPGAQHVIEFHAITSGECWLGIVGEAPVRVRAGDAVAFPRGDAHVFSSAPGLRAPPDLDLHDRRHEALPFQLRTGAGGPRQAELVCGFLGCDARPFNPLLEALPRFLHVRDGGGPGLLRPLMELALAEARARRMGGASVLGRVSELLFVEVVRRHLESLPSDERGWLAGLRDELTGRALALLHREPSRPWTLEELARAVGLSRSALAERFALQIGQPPMQYLARWRMQVATRLLRTATASLDGVAAEVGYRSGAAFSRAFKKVVGVPPAAFRRRATGERAPAAGQDAAASGAPTTVRDSRSPDGAAIRDSRLG